MRVADGEKAVVIGAGMGGISAAIHLNSLGYSVTVLDMADGPGGKARAVASSAGPVATGPTVLTLRAVADRLFALCGTRTEHEVDLIPLPRLARHFWPDGSMLDLFCDRDQTAAAIAAFAGPREADAFCRFDRMTAALYDAFEAPMILAARPDPLRVVQAALAAPRTWPALLPGVTLDRLLRRYFRDPRLVQMFARYATYVGGRPAQSPGVLALVWQAEARGVWAVRQGLHGLADAFARVATAKGVTFRYGTAARRIVRQGGHVTGVELATGQTLPCAACIFAGDPGALRGNLLGDAARDALPASRTPPSLSAWVWAFAARPSGVDLAHHNVFFTAEPAQEFGPIGAGQMPVAPTLYVCAQDRELGTPLPATERFEIIMNGPAMNAAAGHSHTASEDATCRTRSFPTLARMGLTFDTEPGATALLTPAMLAARYPGSMGAIYGASPEGALSAFRRPLARTSLPGLYLAGGGTHPGAGVPMAMLSGQHAATALAEDRISGLLPRPAATPGGMSMASRTTERAPFR